ncbi:MAG: 1-acyl-sn-glycerol-3-phosphate acyltransferase [Crocinitomicaceae bacterium]|nr:1-acyl-sn-glycerol-3-phosphate acyltransferase [Crocinitomicaceae bacterium]
MRAVFSIFKLFLILLWSFICITIATIVYLFSFSQRATVFLAKHLWSRTFLFLIGARVKVIGKEKVIPGQNYLIMSNHCSYADIPTLFRSMPLLLNFIGKEELRKVPFLGFYMKMSGMIFINRSNARRSLESIEAAAKLVKEGKNVVIFPEGTTSETGEIMPFKRGGLELAQASKSTILPVHIKGTCRIWPGSNNFNMRNGKITVTIGDPIPFEEYGQKPTKELLVELREKIIALEN